MEKTTSNDKILEVKNLRISFKTNGGTVKAVRGISFSLYRGRTLAIVGESGSGKSVTSKAILGILAKNKIVEGGQIIYNGQDLLKIDEEHFHKIRGVKISMIFQDPLSSLNPIMIVGKQLTEAMVLKQKSDLKEAHKHFKRVNSILLSSSKDEETLAFIKGSKVAKSKGEDGETTLSIASSPSEHRHLFEEAIRKDLRRRLEAIDLVLEKLSLIEDESFGSQKVEIPAIIAKIKPLYKAILACSLNVLDEKDNTITVFPTILKDILLSAKSYGAANKRLEAAYAKSGVDDFYKLPPAERAKLPEIIPSEEELIKELHDAIEDLLVHLEDLKKEGMSKLESYVDKAIEEYQEAIRKATHLESSKQIKERAIKMMGEVGIAEPERRFKQYPFELSGGMRQRIVIAIALCSSPEILICDEPTTALDVTIQAQILELINKLKKERNLSIVFITHDLGVVANMADDIAVMYAGKIVEYGSDTEIFYDPRHPYTLALLGSMPDLNTKEQLSAIPGTPPNMLLPPKGDAFAARNAHALAIDLEKQPPFFEVSPTHFAASWNLHENAPDFKAPDIVIERIQTALSAHPEFTPKPTNMKNSILNHLKGEKENG